MPTGNLIVMEKGEWACNNYYLDLGRPDSYLQHPSVLTSTVLSTESNWWCGLNRELSGVQVCLTEALKWRALPALKTGLPLPKQGSESQSSSMLSIALEEMEKLLERQTLPKTESRKQSEQTNY